MLLNVEVLEQSFDKIKPHATAFASSFYKNLFSDSPHLQALFFTTPMEEQEKKLMMSLTLVINNLRNLAYLTSMLKDLGARHIKYGAVREYYPLIGASLLKTLESYLETGWTSEVRQAWTDAYAEVAKTMLEGDVSEISKLENARQPYPAAMDSAPTQAHQSAYSLKPKLLLSAFIIAGLLGVGFLCYHLSQKQGNEVIELNHSDYNK